MHVVVEYIMKAGHPYAIHHSIYYVCMYVCTMVDVVGMTSLHNVLVSYIVATGLQGHTEHLHLLCDIARTRLARAARNVTQQVQVAGSPLVAEQTTARFL